MNSIKVNYEYEVILSLLKEEKHGRALAKELKTSLTRIQRILLDMRNNNVIDYREIGKNHIYFIKKNLVAKSFVLNAEKYKFIKLLSKHSFLEPLFRDLIEKSKAKLIILFGSYAKGIAHKNSDIDIYIETTNEQIKKDIEKISDLINVKIGRFNKGDLLIKEIIKNHVLIKGLEDYYEKLEFFK
jgi:predicted nucleotidyltransferase